MTETEKNKLTVERRPGTKLLEHDDAVYSPPTISENHEMAAITNTCYLDTTVTTVASSASSTHSENTHTITASNAPNVVWRNKGHSRYSPSTRVTFGLDSVTKYNNTRFS